MNVHVIPPEDSEVPPQFIQPNFENIPAELKQRPNWVLWVPRRSGSKWTKRPIQPSGYGASTTNARHWSSFEDVRQTYERAVAEGGMVVHDKTGSHRVPIGGVGFVFDGVRTKHETIETQVDVAA